MKRILYILISGAAILTSCKKSSTPFFNPTIKAPVSVEFDNIVGGSALQLNTGLYTNVVGEDFKVTKLKYYVSNFKFTNSNGLVYTVPSASSYFLIDESDATTHEASFNLPEGEYTAVSFIIGVDSLRNTMDISQRTGVLDPTGVGADMYWTWNSGYIFFKMEGTSTASTSMGGSFMYHIGGFGGYSSPTINNIKKVTLNLTSRGTPKLKYGKSTNIHCMVDVLKMFNGATNVSIATNPMVMFNPFSTKIADNYAGMVRHDHTEN